MTYSPSNTIGPYLPTSTYFPENFDEFRVKFLELYKNIAYYTNIKQIGIFDLVEFLTGEQWFNPASSQIKRSTFRQVYSIGAIVAGATSTTAHGITGITSFTHIYGTCVTNVIDYRPIPFASVTAVNQQIQITVNTTNIVIVNGAAAPNITSAIVVLEYLKN